MLHFILRTNHTCFQRFTVPGQTSPHRCSRHCNDLVGRTAGQLREFTGAVSRMACVRVIAPSGLDGVICVGAVGGGEEDSVCGVADLRHIQDLWSTRSCRRTDKKQYVDEEVMY